MLRVRQICTVSGLLFAAAVLFFEVPDASAQKKMSYEQAYARCKKEVVAAYPSGSTDTSGRSARGGACMAQLGSSSRRAPSFRHAHVTA